MSPNVNSGRYCSVLEMLGYLTGWAMLAACFTVDHSNNLLAALSILGLFTLPGTLIFGAIGFAFGGRRMFRPAALCGSALWILGNIIPAIRFAG